VGADPQPSRDREIWLRDLWAEHRRWVAAILLAHKPRDVDLEDLLQDVAMTLVRRVHELRDPSKVRPWLRTVAINAARAAARKRNVRLRLVRPDADPDRHASPDGVAEEVRDEAERALSAAQRLHPDYREPLLLRCVHGMSYRRIGETLGLPMTTVETRITRARRMVREELEFEEDAATMRVAKKQQPAGSA